MRAGDHDRLGPADKGRVNIIFIQRRIGTIRAVK